MSNINLKQVHADVEAVMLGIKQDMPNMLIYATQLAQLSNSLYEHNQALIKGKGSAPSPHDEPVNSRRP